MCFSSGVIAAKEYMLRHFDGCFRAYQGCRIALYTGDCLKEVIENFDCIYHFHCVLEPGCTQVPDDVDLVILTNFRGIREADYHCIHRSCEEKQVPLLDLFGLDQIALRRELDAQDYLTIAQWKELLSGYDVISVSIAWCAADYNETQARWIVRRRFLVLYNWMMSHGKTVVFLAENEDQIQALESEQIRHENRLIWRKGRTRGCLELAEEYSGKKIIHIGTDVVLDGIIPREYGIDSRLIRYYQFNNEITSAARGSWYCADRRLLMEAIDRHKIISFDVFDTLLKRVVLHPKDVFSIVEEQTGLRAFAEARYQIQTEFPHLSLIEIYSRLQERCGFDDQAIELLRETELRLEWELSMPRKSMVELFEYSLSKNKTVILLSDMYLDSGFVRELLEKNGIRGYSALYLSCQYKTLKHEGLFEELLKYTENGEEILHIGDNYYSDYISAREFGLDAFYVPSCLDLALKNGYEAAVRVCRSPADTKLLGLSIAMGFDDPFAPDRDTVIANMVIAPLAMGYLQWACDRLQEKEHDLFLLSSRDGWILLDAYDKLRKRLSDRLPPCKYFYLNRHAAFLTVMDDFELVERFGNLAVFRDDLPTMFRRLFCLSDSQLLPFHGETVEEYYHLHEKVIRESAERFRENYRKYLEIEEIAGKRCAVMDFVSEGSSQAMLEKGVTDPMDGYYVGIPEYVSKFSRNISYYLDEDLMDYDSEMRIEAFFTSPEPALDHIGELGKPVFAEEPRGRQFLDRVGEIHRMVRQYMDRYLDSLYDPKDDISKELILELCRSVRQFDVENRFFDDLSGLEIAAKP